MDEIIIATRQNFESAEKALRECDDLYAGDIKHKLEKMYIGDKIVRFVGIGKAEPITAKDISFYLAQNFRVYVDAEQISFDKNTHRRNIRLNSSITASVAVKTQTVIKNVFISNCSADRENASHKIQYKS